MESFHEMRLHGGVTLEIGALLRFKIKETGIWLVNTLGRKELNSY